MCLLYGFSQSLRSKVYISLAKFGEKTLGWRLEKKIKPGHNHGDTLWHTLPVTVGPTPENSKPRMRQFTVTRPRDLLNQLGLSLVLWQPKIQE